MVFKNELYPIHFYGRVRGKCDGRLQNWPGIANERPKFLAMIFFLAECKNPTKEFKRYKKNSKRVVYWNTELSGKLDVGGCS